MGLCLLLKLSSFNGFDGRAAQAGAGIFTAPPDRINEQIARWRELGFMRA
jgi:hypothetical protein